MYLYNFEVEASPGVHVDFLQPSMCEFDTEPGIDLIRADLLPNNYIFVWKNA